MVITKKKIALLAANQNAGTIVAILLIFNNYSPKSQLILLNNPRDEVSFFAGKIGQNYN